MRQFVFLLSLFGCIRTPAKITIQDPPTRVLGRNGETHALRAKVYDKEGLLMEANEPVVWSSSDTDVLSVNEMGLITALHSGTAAIRAQVGSVQAELTTRVAIVGGVALEPAADLVLRLGRSTQLQALVTDDRGAPMPHAAVSWFSSSRAVAVSDGSITAQAIGSSDVSASSGDRSATVHVVVK